MDLVAFRKDCGACTDEELVSACAKIDPSIQHPDQAKAWIWALVKRLLDTERYGLAGLVLWGEALFNIGPVAVQKLFRFVRSTQNMIVLGAAAMGKTYSLICYCLQLAAMRNRKASRPCNGYIRPLLSHCRVLAWMGSSGLTPKIAIALLRWSRFPRW